MKLIDAEALLSEMQETADVIARATGNTAGWVILMKIIEIIKRYPTIEPKRGRWLKKVIVAQEYGTTVLYDCSNCGKWSISRYKYCPNCGAKMEEVEE